VLAAQLRQRITEILQRTAVGELDAVLGVGGDHAFQHLVEQHLRQLPAVLLRLQRGRRADRLQHAAGARHHAQTDQHAADVAGRVPHRAGIDVHLVPAAVARLQAVASLQARLRTAEAAFERQRNLALRIVAVQG
jgi:hypothetical protein